MLYDTLIIGAGMSGLAAGIRLAYYGKRVCILERHTTIGGLNSFYRLEGRNYDVGLHAVTNFRPKGATKGPLPRLLRQLKLSWDEFALVPQIGSRIAFPGATLDFTNDLALFEAEVARAFPSQVDGFRNLVTQLVDYDDLNYRDDIPSARTIVASYITDPLLVEMLFCPLMYYGSAREHDMDWPQFCIMFRSIFCEGFARPVEGVRRILKVLVRKFKELGGELKLRAGVSHIANSNGNVGELVLDDGSTIQGRTILSSAGWAETMRLCDDSPPVEKKSVGQLSVIESISVLDRQPRELGCDRTIVFFNDCDRFHWTVPDELADVRSGVICSPNNFDYDEDSDANKAEGMMRITALANHDRWTSLGEEDYRLAKQHWYDATIASAIRFVPDFRSSVVATDMFTPKTIVRFTGHLNGAVYGAAEKHPDGRTHLDNLFICGTDQGLVGIVGSMMSGILMANAHLLKPETTSVPS